MTPACGRHHHSGAHHHRASFRGDPTRPSLIFSVMSGKCRPFAEQLVRGVVVVACLAVHMITHAQGVTRLTPAEFQTRAAELISERVQVTGELRGTTLHDPRGSAQVRISLDRAPATTTRWLNDNGCRTRCSGVTLTGQIVVLPSTGRPALMISSASRPAAANTGQTTTVATPQAPSEPQHTANNLKPADAQSATNIASPAYRAALNEQLIPGTRDGRGAFGDANARGLTGTWSIDCQRPGSPRIHLLTNGLVLEHGDQRTLSNAQYTTVSTFGVSPPQHFLVEYGGDSFTVYVYQKQHTLHLTLGEADENIYSEFISGGAKRFMACEDVAAAKPS